MLLLYRHRLLKPFYIILTLNRLHSTVYHRANKWLFPDASVEFSSINQIRFQTQLICLIRWSMTAGVSLNTHKQKKRKIIESYLLSLSFRESVSDGVLDRGAGALMHHRIPKRDLQEARHHQDQMRCVTQGNCHTPIILCCRKRSKEKAEKNQTFMSRWLKPESQWLGLTDTLANFVFEKANHTWATRVLWEKLHLKHKMSTF